MARANAAALAKKAAKASKPVIKVDTPEPTKVVAPPKPVPPPATGVPEWAAILRNRVDMKAALDPAFAVNIEDFKKVGWRVDVDDRCIWRIATTGRRQMTANDREVLIERLDDAGQVVPGWAARYAWQAEGPAKTYQPIRVG